MAFSDSVIRYTISSAGWYPLPDTDVAFPYGMKATPRLPDVAPDIEKSLRIPVSVLVGKYDNGRGGRFNKLARIDRTQGQMRLALNNFKIYQKFNRKDGITAPLHQ